MAQPITSVLVNSSTTHSDHGGPVSVRDWMTRSERAWLMAFSELIERCCQEGLLGVGGRLDLFVGAVEASQCGISLWVGATGGHDRPFGLGRAGVVQEGHADAVTVGLLEHRQIAGELHPDGALGAHLGVSATLIGPGRRHDEADEEGVGE